ncbi:MAG: bifunctional glutamate--cysteine ligase GshA/glutathione synthetase GshB [Clostridium sp.]
MLNEIRGKITKWDFINGTFGLERESLRVNDLGKLSLREHPENFGNKMKNSFITTDFSESQIELITPTFTTLEEVYEFQSILYDIVALEIKDEYLWPQSMPCDLPEEHDIPIAQFCTCVEDGKKAKEYREKLFEKYGGKKQLISGIHYNFSYNEKLIETLYSNLPQGKTYREYRDDIYLKVARNYLRYSWVLVYLLGGSAVIHESFNPSCVKRLKEIYEESFSNEVAVSYRNSECGYGNKIELFPNYNSVEEYIHSIEKFIEQGHIDEHRELYSQIRLKPRDAKNFTESLLSDGINYLEIRSIDINPFDKIGISLEDLKFVNLFTIFLLDEDESKYDNWQKDAEYNQKIIANHGRVNVILKIHGGEIRKDQWIREILDKLKRLNHDLQLGYDKVITNLNNKIENSSLTYSSRITELCKEKGYLKANIDLAKNYREEAYNKRFVLEGYEDLELSTQILLKAAIKRGVNFKVLDRKDNFISLKRENHIEYVKEATKTSKDNYISVLLMENKVATKIVLDENNIKVPSGSEFFSLDEAICAVDEYINSPIVIKPKSTNFGLGISIFAQGGDKEDIIQALKLAFIHDDTVLIEEFIKGNEYRFLVVGNEVLGILNRMPANIIGDGKNNIKELVNIKNKDSLRGVGYKKPLEKINLDYEAELFLKQRAINFNYIPTKDEVVYLRENSNISTGGDSIDYTEDIPGKFKDIAVRASKAVGANICGVDMIIADYKNKDSNYSVIELNFNPAIHIHSFPFKGRDRNVADKLLDLLGFKVLGKCK